MYASFWNFAEAFFTLLIFAIDIPMLASVYGTIPTIFWIAQPHAFRNATTTFFAILGCIMCIAIFFAYSTFNRFMNQFAWFRHWHPALTFLNEYTPMYTIFRA